MRCQSQLTPMTALPAAVTGWFNSHSNSQRFTPPGAALLYHARCLWHGSEVAREPGSWSLLLPRYPAQQLSL